MAEYTKELGKISGRILVFGGPYSNTQALQAMKEVAVQQGFAPDNIFCTGDMVGYCAQPSESLDFVQDWGIHAIQGNVEENILKGSEDCGCNFDEGGRCDILSKQWFPYAVAHMTERNMDYLASLPKKITFEIGGKRVTMLHGAMENISEFIFKSTDPSIKKHNLDLAGADIVLAGHCGLPFVDQMGDRYWCNAGVIGMPANDGRTEVWYMTLDVTTKSVEPMYCNLSYDHTLAHQKMIINKLPPTYADTLLTGIWDNCDILPPYETSRQGQPIEIHSELTI